MSLPAERVPGGAGLIEPPVAADVVRRYWVANVAVYVADEDGAVIVCVEVPPSLQLLNEY